MIPVPTVVPPALSGLTDDLINRVNQFAFPAQGNVPAPKCEKQGKFNFGGQLTDFPHVRSPLAPYL